MQPGCRSGPSWKVTEWEVFDLFVQTTVSPTVISTCGGRNEVPTSSTSAMAARAEPPDSDAAEASSAPVSARSRRRPR